MTFSRRILLGTCILGATLVPALASAHEVYVLTPQEITEGIQTPPFNEVAVAAANPSDFAFWAFVAVFTVLVVFFISTSRALERRLDPVLTRFRKYAAPIARITVGISFIAAAYYGANYGPELPLATVFGSWTTAIRILLVIIGTLITFGIYARTSALVALVLFSIAVYFNGSYMLTYLNYFGEIILVLILGNHHGVGPRPFKKSFDRVARIFAPYSFAFLRVCFGIGMLYASFYAKVLHNNLALEVASLPLAGHSVSIAQALGFEPHFLVLGAAIIETVIAVFFILGIEIRFTILFVLVWLSLSLYWFGESVWPHIILLGIPAAFFLYGYDKYSLEGRFFKKGGREPVL